jgi:hypothetical protein
LADETEENHEQDSRDLKPGPPEYEAGVLTSTTTFGDGFLLKFRLFAVSLKTLFQ